MDDLNQKIDEDNQNQITIALIEDEPLLSNLLKQRLEKDNLKVIAIQDGAKALDILKNQKVDLILLDIILPKVSGFEIMEKIQQDPTHKDVPIIIISNLGQESDVKKGESFGAVGYFVKAHVSIEELVGEIKSFIDNKLSK
ncbi:MAG: response regulator [Candidatus Paceibacterota bacterium]